MSNASRLPCANAGVLRRRHELVLGPADDVREAAGRVGIACHGVVQEVGMNARPQLTQQQALANLVEHVRVLRQTEVRRDGPTARGCRTSGSCGPTAGSASPARALRSKRSSSSAAALTLYVRTRMFSGSRAGPRQAGAARARRRPSSCPCPRRQAPSAAHRPIRRLRVVPLSAAKVRSCDRHSPYTIAIAPKPTRSAVPASVSHRWCRRMEQLGVNVGRCEARVAQYGSAADDHVWVAAQVCRRATGAQPNATCRAARAAASSARPCSPGPLAVRGPAGRDTVGR